MHCVFLTLLIVNPVSHKTQFAVSFTGQWESIDVTTLLHMQIFVVKPRHKHCIKLFRFLCVENAQGVGNNGATKNENVETSYEHLDIVSLGLLKKTQRDTFLNYVVYFLRSSM